MEKEERSGNNPLFSPLGAYEVASPQECLETPVLYRSPRAVQLKKHTHLWIVPTFGDISADTQWVYVQGPGIWETETVMEQAQLVALRTSWWTVTPMWAQRDTNWGLEPKFHHIKEWEEHELIRSQRQESSPKWQWQMTRVPFWAENCSKYNDPYLTRHWLNVSLAPGINRMLHPSPGSYEKL